MLWAYSNGYASLISFTEQPVYFVFIMMLNTMNGPISHCGHDKLKVGALNIQVGDFFHQLHHRFFDCHYGVTITPWDKWFHSFHGGTPNYLFAAIADSPSTFTYSQRRQPK